MRCRAANSCTSTCCARTVSSSSSSRENSGTCRSSSTLHGMAEVLATQLSEEVRKEGLGSQVPLSSCHPRTPGPRPACWLGWSSRGGKGICVCSALAFLVVIPAGDLRLPLPYPYPYPYPLPLPSTLYPLPPTPIPQRPQDHIKIIHSRVLNNHLSAALLVLDRHLQPQRTAQPVLRLAHIRIHHALRHLHRLRHHLRVQQVLHILLRRPNGKMQRHHLPRHLRNLFHRQRQQRARMSEGQLARFDMQLHIIRQLQQAQKVCHRR